VGSVGADRVRVAVAGFVRAASVISVSGVVGWWQAIRAVLTGGVGL
jgi:hypothetical protein